jgi:hypothetical protein
MLKMVVPAARQSRSASGATVLKVACPPYEATFHNQSDESDSGFDSGGGNGYDHHHRNNNNGGTWRALTFRCFQQRLIVHRYIVEIYS